MKRNAIGLLILGLTLAACQPESEKPKPASDKNRLEKPRAKVSCPTASFLDTKFQGVIGGEIVSEDSWIARKTLWLYTEAGGGSMCTATLIDRDVVLTAAHCVDMVSKASDLKAVFSAQPSCDFVNGDLLAKSITGSKVLIHEGYDKNSDDFFVRSDLALVKLSAPAPASVETVELKLSDRPWSSFDQILVAGYGKTVGGTGDNEDPIALRALVRQPLRESNLEQVADRIRTAIFGSAMDTVTFGLVKNMLFDSSFEAESIWIDQTDEKGICSGDSGGPAYVVEDGRIKQIGVASVVLQDKPSKTCLMTAASTNVRKYRDWIGRSYTQLTGRSADRVLRP